MSHTQGLDCYGKSFLVIARDQPNPYELWFSKNLTCFDSKWLVSERSVPTLPDSYYQKTVMRAHWMNYYEWIDIMNYSHSARRAMHDKIRCDVLNSRRIPKWPNKAYQSHIDLSRYLVAETVFISFQKPLHRTVHIWGQLYAPSGTTGKQNRSTPVVVIYPTAQDLLIEKLPIWLV